MQVRRDPRFDDLSGKLNTDLFQKSFPFLTERRAQDQAEMQKGACRCVRVWCACV